jgi:tetratricopeptide (TPR) repeat protein
MKLAGSLCWLALSALSHAGPTRILVVQIPLNTADQESQVYLCDFLANELTTEAKSVPIVYGMSDPLFRDAVYGNRLKAPPEKPTLEQATSIARSLDAEYLLIVEARMVGPRIKAQGRLVKNGKVVWKDANELTVTIGNKNSSDDAARSVAHTWSTKMASGPLGTAVVATVAPTPDPTAGQTPVVPTLIVPSAPKVDNESLRRQLNSLIATGQLNDALLVARDTVDEAPLDGPRRQELVRVLGVLNEPRLAATEARRAADLQPENLELRLLAARAWLAAGDNDEAQSDFNEAVARNPNSPETRLLLGELSLVKGAPETALPHLDAAIKVQPSFVAFYERAICRALLGGADGVTRDLGEAAKQTPPQPETTRRMAVLALRSISTATTQSIDALRSLISRAAVRPKDVEVRDALETQTRQTKSRSSFLEAAALDVDLKDARNRYALCQSMILQVLSDIQAFVRDGSDDSLTDARIDLGEAIKQAAAAKAALAGK